MQEHPADAPPSMPAEAAEPRQVPAEAAEPREASAEAVESREASAEAVEPGEPSTGGGRVPAPAPPGDPVLSEREQAILRFEERWWKHAGAKEQAIRDTFDLSTTRYYQILNGLLDNPAAQAAHPVVVGRLRRMRATRARSRGR